MKSYPIDRFPETILRPEVVAKHEEHLKELEKDVEGYSAVGHRGQTLYDWALRLFENLGLSTVESKYFDSLAITKTRLVMFIVLIDDTVDNIDKRNFELFEELIKIPFNLEEIKSTKFKAENVNYLEFTKTIWNEIITEVKKYPNYEKYKEAFNFDLKQLINSMEYSKFVNTYPHGVNLVENNAYVHHGMFVLIQTDLDLMCSKKFDDQELGLLREISYVSQKMARIGNVINTYPRELLESDMSSEALVRFQKDYGNDFKFKLNKLLNLESRYIKFEDKLIHEWQKEYDLIKEMAKKFKSIEGDRFIQEREFIQKAYQMKADNW
jgi:hypothetical protein